MTFNSFRFFSASGDEAVPVTAERAAPNNDAKKDIYPTLYRHFSGL